MISTSIFYVTLSVTLICVASAYVAIRKQSRFAFSLSVSILLFQSLLCLSFGMGGLRAHIEIARAHGEGDGFVRGMIERDEFFSPPRMSMLAVVTGFYIIMLFAGNAYFGIKEKSSERNC